MYKNTCVSIHIQCSNEITHQSWLDNNFWKSHHSKNKQKPYLLKFQTHQKNTKTQNIQTINNDILHTIIIPLKHTWNSTKSLKVSKVWGSLCIHVAHHSNMTHNLLKHHQTTTLPYERAAHELSKTALITFIWALEPKVHLL